AHAGPSGLRHRARRDGRGQGARRGESTLEDHACVRQTQLGADERDARGLGHLPERDLDLVAGVEREGGGGAVPAGEGHLWNLTGGRPGAAAPPLVRASYRARYSSAQRRHMASCSGAYASRMSSAATVAGCKSRSSARAWKARWYTQASWAGSLLVL